MRPLSALATLSSVLTLAALAAEYSNPVIGGDWSDPGVIRVGSDYYSVRSTFGWQPGLHIVHSRDLVHWRHIGHALLAHSAIERGTTRGGVWGADIGFNPNTRQFVVYAPIANRIWAMSSAKAGGPYSTPVELGLQGIDPGFFADSDGRLYLVWDWGKIVELTPDGLSVKREVGSLGLGQGRNFEGPSLLKRGDWYYCVYSTGGTRPHQDSAINSVRARRLEGPWERDPANPQLQALASSGAAFQGPAHGTLIRTQDGEWFVAYHAHQLSHYSLGRSMLLDPVRWTQDGWWRTEDGRIPSLRARAPALPRVPYELQASDEFVGPRLGLQWFFHTRPDGEAWSLTSRPGWLRALPAADALTTTFLQSVREKAFAFESLLEFEPAHDGDRAGLTMYHDPNMNFTLAVGRKGGRRVLTLEKRNDGRESVVASLPCVARSVRLRIRINERECAAAEWSEDGRPWAEVPGTVCFGDSGDPDLGWIGREKRNRWTAAAFGVFADGSTHADFAWFRVRRREIN